MLRLHARREDGPGAGRPDVRPLAVSGVGEGVRRPGQDDERGTASGNPCRPGLVHLQRGLGAVQPVYPAETVEARADSGGM